MLDTIESAIEDIRSGKLVIVVDDEEIPMVAGPNHTFEYTFRNCTRDIDFRFYEEKRLQ